MSTMHGRIAPLHDAQFEGMRGADQVDYGANRLKDFLRPEALCAACRCVGSCGSAPLCLSAALLLP
jgi:hypothetical protein